MKNHSSIVITKEIKALLEEFRIQMKPRAGRKKATYSEVIKKLLDAV